MGKRAAHYTLRIADQICERIVMGDTLQEALKNVGFLAPAYHTVLRWLEIYPEFNEKYERARRLQADIHADKMLEYSREVIEKPNLATAYRVATNILQWQASIRNRQRYNLKGEDPRKSRPMNDKEIRAEIKRLESELGIAKKDNVKTLKVVNANGKQ